MTTKAKTPTNAIASLAAKLKPELGQLVHSSEEHGFAAVAFPGLNNPVLIQINDGPGGQVLRVGCLVAETVDLSTDGLTMYCLRESSRLLFGNIEIGGNGLIVEHVVFADLSGKQLAAVVLAIATAALDIRRHLDLMGAILLLDPTGEDHSTEEAA